MYPGWAPPSIPQNEAGAVCNSCLKAPGWEEGGWTLFPNQDTLASEENKTQIIKQRPRHFFLLFLGQATLRRCAADLFRAPTAVKCSTDSSLPSNILQWQTSSGSLNARSLLANLVSLKEYFANLPNL